MGVGIGVGVYKPLSIGLQCFYVVFHGVALVTALSPTKLRYMGMTTENTNMLEGILQGSLILEDFSFYRADFASTKVSFSLPL